ncbi:hypothetical protein [Rhodoferax sp.]|uniref:hypothetical protein n=1 Tax=Rhodoferax sp. TaxID=50421 RepID=UPI002615301C|nr:hypothetical protein [Rhodoferax sp.]MDD2811066.1 hypothetical protein [Rhodoferax sp.]
MTSKLDPFFNQLFEQLAGEGLSYRTVCKSLLSHGVEISPQALRSWFVRRTQKIAQRSSALPSRACDSSTVIPDLRLQSGLFSSGEEGAALPNRSSSASVSTADGPLSLLIKAEEQKLAAATPLQSYLLPKKKPLDS